MAPKRGRSKVAAKKEVATAVDSQAVAKVPIRRSRRASSLAAVGLPQVTPITSCLIDRLSEPFDKAADELIQATTAALADLDVTMFKIDVASVCADGDADDDVVVAEAVSGLTSDGQSLDACQVVPLVLVRALPAVSGPKLTAYSYAEALVHRARAHLMFEQPDDRLIATRSVCAAATSKHNQHLVYLFGYVHKQPVKGGKKAMDVDENCESDQDPAAENSKRKPLKQRKKCLDSVTEEEVEQEVPVVEIQRGKRKSSTVPSTPPAKTSKVPSRLSASPSKRRVSVILEEDFSTPTTTPSQSRSNSVTSVATSKQGRRSSVVVIPEQDELLSFFDSLDVNSAEQSRIAHTVRYAKLRWRRQVSSDAFYKLLKKRPRGQQQQQQQEQLMALQKLSKDDVEQRKQLTLDVYRQLGSDDTEQTRVAFTLRHMLLRYQINVDSKTLLQWLKKR